LQNIDKKIRWGLAPSFEVFTTLIITTIFKEKTGWRIKNETF